jgi:hypothetical protein
MIEGGRLRRNFRSFSWRHGNGNMGPTPDKTYFPTLNKEGDDLIMVIGNCTGEKTA